VVLREGSSDRTTFEALTRSKLAVSVCMKDFVPKQGAKVVQEEDDDPEA
jgi:hypothetical protein